MKETPADDLVMNELRVQLLGGFSVSAEGRAIPETEWKSRRVRNLFKLLALTPGHRLHRDQVIDTLWPNSDLSAAANNLHQTLYTTRRLLEAAGAGALALEDGFLSLAGGAGQALQVDIEQFEAAAAQTKDCQDPKVFRVALELYRGDLLPDDLYEEWTVQRRESLRQKYMSLLLDLARLHESQHNFSAGIAALLQLLAVDRSHEEAHIGLMRLYALSGQRQQALRQYQALGEVLKAELDSGPSESTIQLFEDIQSGRFSPQRTTGFPSQPTAVASKNNLPNLLTSFIGREKQISELSQLVRDHRLVTLTGAGGTGKTRLAIKVAEGLLENFPGGTFLVELAPLSDPELVPQACTRTLEVIEQPGFSFTELLAHYLKEKDLLLILDNCEHVIGACTHLVDRLLKACPRLHILATSREILSVPGENPYRVPSLEVPDSQALPPLAEMAQVEAVRLFVERAALVAPGLTLTSANAGAIAQIGQRLDGIPLAIELAAGRARMMTVEQIAARLNNAFRLLTGGSRAVLPRQQTLKATIDWSYNLLSLKERLILQRLSVFVGGWTLEAAEAVCADPLDEQFCLDERLDSFEMLDLLAQLVDKSLVLAETGESETRYHMLETIRQYARDRLIEAGCGKEIRDGHLAYFTHLSGQAEPHLRGKGQIEWFSWLDHELDNLRVALEWSLTENIEQGLKLMADLMWFWWIRGLFIEGIEWLEKLLAAESAERGASPLENGRGLQRARGLRAFNYLSSYIYSLSSAERQALIEESIAILRRLGDAGRRELGISLMNRLYLQPGLDLPPAERQEMLEIFRQENDQFYFSEYLFSKSGWAYNHGEVDQAEAYEKESLVISREIEDYDGISSRAELLGFYRIHSGDYATAEALFIEALEACRKVRNRWWEMVVHGDLVLLALARGEYEEAARLNEVPLKYFQEMNLHLGISGALKVGLIAAWAMGEYPRAVQLGEEVIKIYPEIPDNPMQAYFYLGRVAMAKGDFSQTEALFKRAASLLAPGNVPFNSGPVIIGVFLLGWAALLCKQEKMTQAARVMGAVEDIYRRTGYALTALERSEHEEVLAATRAALGEEAFSAAWQQGQAMTLDQTIEYVNALTM